MVEKNKEIKEYNPRELFDMMHDTSSIISDESSIRLASCGFASVESETLTNSVEFWKWLDRNYQNCGHFSSAEKALAYINSSESHRAWAEKIIQGKGYEFDWQIQQRKAFKNLFKVYNAGDIANRPGSDVTAHNLLTGENSELQMKAYRSKNAPHLKNTPKDMTVVTNVEKVEQVKAQGYKDVVAFKDRDAIIRDTDKRMQQIEVGKAGPQYTLSNVGQAMAKAGILGFAIGVGSETLASYRRWKTGELSTEEYVKEIMLSGSDAGVSSAMSAGIMIPISASIAAAGVTSVITIPISFTVSAAVNKVIAPAFARGDYRKILSEAKYYDDLVYMCSSLADVMEESTYQYESFIKNMYYQNLSFYAMRGEPLPANYQKDFEYFATLSQDKAEIAIAGMLALMEDSDSMLDSIKNQDFFKRMIFTVIGKNKVTKEEIKKNHEKLTAYISQAVSVLYERQSVDERVTQLLGKQILQLCSDNIVLNKKIDTVNRKLDLTRLSMQIDKKRFAFRSPLLSLICIVSRITPDDLADREGLWLVQRSMEDAGILSAEPITERISESLAEFPKEGIGLVYASLLKEKSNELVNKVLSSFENLILMKTEAVHGNTQSFDGSVTYSELYHSLLDSVREKANIIENTSFSSLGLFQRARALFLDGKLVDAFSAFEQAASINIPQAYYYLGEYYLNGYGATKEDDNIAYSYYEKGMELGDPLCTYKYGYVKFGDEDELQKKWLKQHFKYLDPLLRENNPEALDEQGNYYLTMYSNNMGKLNSAKACFKKSAELGYWPSAFNFSNFYFNTDNTIEYSSLLVKVDWYVTKIMFGRYYMLLDDETCKYISKSMECFTGALNLREDAVEPAGYIAFVLNTGLIKDSIRTGISAASIPMYYRASLSSESAYYLFELGSLFLNGLGAEEKGRDYEKAFEYLSRSYEMDPQESNTFLLGSLYWGGFGIKQDSSKAVKLFLEAAEKGNVHALNALSMCYKDGDGVKKNLNKAKEYQAQYEKCDKIVNPFSVMMSYLHR